MKTIYVAKVKEIRELKALCKKMFALESDLVFWNNELEKHIEEVRFEYQDRIKELENELEVIRTEFHFTDEDKKEMKKELEKLMGE